MTNYEKAIALWQQKHITTDAELSEVLNSQRISFAYHSGKIENEGIPSYILASIRLLEAYRLSPR